MLEARIYSASIVKKLFESVRDIITEANMEASENGLVLQAMDSTHVALLNASLFVGGFSHYRCDKQRSFGLNIASVCKVLKLANPNDQLALQAPDESSVLTFIYENPEEERMVTFGLNLMGVDAESYNIPDDDNHMCVVKMSSKEFTNIIKSLLEINDLVNITVDKSGIKFETTGSIGSGDIYLKKREALGDEAVGIEIKSTATVSQTFALKYLNQFAKCSVLSDLVVLEFDETRPIGIKFNIQNTAEKTKPKLGEIRFYLAPRLAEDD